MIRTESTVLTAAVEAAVRAPSPHNTQPWIFELGPTGIDLFLDTDRLLKVCDADGREATLACGAALLNIRLAIAAAGRSCEIDVLPDRTRPALLAHVELGLRRRPHESELRLAAAIPRRFTNRRPFAEQAVPRNIRNLLTAAAHAEGGRLVLLDEIGKVSKVASLVRRADEMQAEDPAFQAEKRAWTSAEPHRLDGVPAAAGGPHPDGGLLPVRHHVASSAVRAYERDPVVAVLLSRTDGPRAQLRAGEAMQRVLLTATDAGLSSSFLSQPMEIPSLRAELRTLLGGDEYPQTVLRFGYGYPGAPTPRRDLAMVTKTGER
ncbi:Acg family FMN-binding oxidoreductase [Amycolatopsis sp. NPDC059657]|uniref:Acg family FMN-binding oxidoreductase n=1 Tax=Amycolatopsis sp. NPDC059657 TaxID=3346899 RepID=UPI00366D6F79